MEYRGYDSVGHATLDNGKIYIKKDRGKISEVETALHLSDMPGAVGIGHTRWATHGAPSKENAHPHTDCDDIVAVVHNGIIENFLELRQRLESKNHKFSSRTDTEAISHLIEDFLKEGHGFPEAVRLTVRELQGAYALAVISKKEPDKIVCVRKESPLVIGLGTTGNYCASDIPAFLHKTKRFLLMEDGEMAVLTRDRAQLMDVATGEAIMREPMTVTWNVESAVKKGFPHYMLKEIHEQPAAIRDALRTHPIYLDLMASILDKAKQVYVVACGTSYHASLAASYSFANLARLNAQPVIASEFIDLFGPTIDDETVVFAVSQSGETADTLAAVRGARERGASVLSLTNVMGSTLTRLSDVYIGQNSGPEIGVAATKTFTAQVSVLTSLAIALAKRRGSCPAERLQEITNVMREAPDIVRYVLATQENKVKEIVAKYLDRRNFCFLGRGNSVSTALEGRLKLLELSYLSAIAFPAGESKHGFISVIEPGYPVIFVAPKDETYAKIIGNVMEMKARGADIISLIGKEDNQIRQLSNDVIEIPEGIPSALTPLVYIVPLQLFAYYMSVSKGYDPDFPRNLAKSVTVQ